MTTSAPPLPADIGFKLDANFFAEGPSGIFDDNRAVHCTSAELAQMNFAMAWFETQLPSGGRKGVYVPGPVTGGKVAYDVAKEVGVKNIADLPGKLGWDEFKKRVIDPNVYAALKRGRYVQQKIFPDAPIVNPIGAEGSVRIMKLLGAEDGKGKKWGQDAFMAVWLKVIEQRIDRMVLDDWAKSNGGIEEVIHASLIQAGLNERRPNSDMEIVDMKGQPFSLYQRALAVSETLRNGLDNGFEVPVPATALARLFHIHALNVDMKLNPQKAHCDTFAYDESAMSALVGEIKPLLLEKCVGYMNIKDLGPEYQEARDRLSPPKSDAPRP